MSLKLKIKSAFMSINWRDLVRGSIVALVTGLLTALKETLMEGHFPTTWASWEQILIVGAIALISYLLLNLPTNSKGQMFTREPKVDNSVPTNTNCCGQQN